MLGDASELRLQIAAWGGKVAESENV